ncbi:MAG TPA: hypothetical protein VGA36_01295 [Nitriliruptorales bacterium]
MQRRRTYLTAAVAAVLVFGGPALAHPPVSVETYRWIRPPEGVAAGQRAAGRTAEVTPDLLAAGASSVWTPDAQAVLTIRAVEVSSPAIVTITPIDPASLPPLESLISNGNAYRVQVTADSWQPEATELLLATPWPAATVFRLGPDGWVDLEVTPGLDGRIAAPAQGGRVFVAATTSTDGHDSWWASFSHDPLRPWLAGVGMAIAGAAALRRGQRRRARQPAAQAA